MTENSTWYRVANSRFVIAIANDGEIVDAIQLRSFYVQATEIELMVTTDMQRLEGSVFHVGARGLASIAAAIHAGLKNPTGAQINSKLASLFAGDPMFQDVLAGLCRAVAGCDAESEAAYFVSCAQKELSERPWMPIELQIRNAATGLPLGLSLAD